MILINNQIIRMAGIVISCVVISACDTEFSNPVGSQESTSGTADFSRFVSIGDSLTAGYGDSALYLHGQENSYPSVLAAQFAKAGGGNFSQPLVSDNLGGLLFDGNPNPDFGIRLILNANPDPDVDGESPSPEPIDGSPTTEVIGSGLNGNIYNNIGVPGAKSYHAGVAGYGNAAGLPASANPYFVRFANDPATSSMIGDAAAQLPSFYVMWIGNNDVLSYATSGGVGADSCNPLVAICGSNDITDPAAFAGVYAQLVGAFTAVNPDVKGVLVNVPDVGTIPFFTTVPYNPVPLDQATADFLNGEYASYNGALLNPGFALSADEIAKRTISFSAGQNALVIEDESLTDLSGFTVPSIRQATAEDLILLPTSAYIGTEDENSAGTTPPAGKPWGVGTPMADSDVLIPTEIDAINVARLFYNATIKEATDGDASLVHFDAAAFMETLAATGIDYGTGFIDDTYATGGGFSLDGVHPTARGYAVIANGIIDAINEGFDANVLRVDPGAKSTIFFK